MDVVSAGVDGGLQSFTDDMMFGDGGYDLLDAGVADGYASKMEIELCEAMSIPTAMIKKDHDDSWLNMKGSAGIGMTMADAGCYRVDHEYVKSAYATEPDYDQRSFFDETNRAIDAVTKEVNEHNGIEDMNEVDDMQAVASTSGIDVLEDRGLGLYPLKKLVLSIGTKKKFHFSVVDKKSHQANVVVSNPVNPVVHSPARTCSLCKITFGTRQDWVRHMSSSHHGSKTYTCNECGLGFATKNSFGIHYRKHEQGKRFECGECGKSFARESNYHQHVRLHQSGRKHFCEVCGRCFNSVNMLSHHQATCIQMANGEFINTDRQLRFQCQYCPKHFHHRRDKNIHERIHTGEKPYACGYCGRGFTQSQALTIHIRTHTGEKPFKCDVCSKEFKDSSALRKHEYKHTIVDAELHGLYEDEEEGLVEDQIMTDYGHSMWTVR